MTIRYPASALRYAPPLSTEPKNTSPRTIKINALVLTPSPRLTPVEPPAPPLDVVHVEEGGEEA